MTRGEKQFVFLLFLPLVAIAMLTILSFLVWGEDVAMLISFGGCAAVMAMNFAYIVLFDSRKRWPNATAFQRFVNVVTFTR